MTGQAAAGGGAATVRPRRGARRWLVGCLTIVLLVALALVGAVALVWARATVDTTGAVSFDRPLAIPPLAESRIEDGRRVFDLRVQEGTTDFGVGDEPSLTWGYNGSYLGPTLRATRGEHVQVNVTNEVGETTTTHWHGHHLPAEMDGGPHQPIEPGQTWSPHWTIDQPAATTWYHPHLHGATAAHVYRGLAGMFILDDANSLALDLPSTYGVDDIPLIVQDRAFDSAGRVVDRAPMFSPVGSLGDTVLANGTVGGYLEVTTELVRLRLLNGSNARVYDFGFSDGREFSLIATDGGLLPAPHVTDHVQLSPGERAEIVVAMRPGEDVVLRSRDPDLGAGFLERFSGGDDSFDVVQLRAADRLAPSPPLPQRLVPPPDLDPTDARVTRTFRMGDMNINGASMDMGRIDEVVEVDSTEIWEVSNADGVPHSFHVHDVQFRVVAVDGRPPGPELSGWKDTVYVAPGGTVRLVLRFTDYTDPDSPYMYHCHVLAHEDLGMMGQFVVVEPGQRPALPPAAGHDSGGHDPGGHDHGGRDFGGSRGHDHGEGGGHDPGGGGHEHGGGRGHDH
jgi:FtsP/CotA-like multicopper oxidase with cupredoxin domain